MRSVPDLSENVILQIEEDVKQLIREITLFEPSDDNFVKCVDFVMCRILNDETASPPWRATLEKLEEFSTKYDYFGFPNYSEQLRSAVDVYLHSNPDSKEKNETDPMLHFLLQLSTNTFKTDVLYSLEERLVVSRTARLPEEVTEQEKINWFSYLREGWEKFQLPSDEEKDSDEEQTLPMTNTEASIMVKDSNSGKQFNELFTNFDRKEMIIPNEDTEVRKTLTDAQEAKCWFANNVQSCWWNGERCTISKSIYPSANFGLNWEKRKNDFLIQNGSHPTNYQYHDEYKIIRELLWVLVAEDSRIRRRINFLKEQVSVPSLIQETFSSLIADVVDAAKKYHVLSSFCNETCIDSVSQMPFTIQAYQNAIKDICQSLLQRVIEEEKIVQRQREIYTLLTLHNNLQPYFKLVNFVYELHDAIAVAKWLEVPRLSCVRLLSILFAKYEQHPSQLHRKILLKIFFEVFKIYANIIDVWFSEGKLNDWKNEFFIEKKEDGQFVALPEDTLKNLDVPLASFFQPVSSKLLVCCQIIEFLSKLDRMTELRREMLKEGKLVDQFIDEVKKQSFLSDEISTEFQSMRNSQDNVGLFIQPNREYIGGGQTIPYLLNAFGDQLMMNKSSADDKKNSCDSLDKKLESLRLMPTGLALEQTLCMLITKREAIIIGVFKSSIIDDYNFLDHIRNLTMVLLMNWNGFYDSVIALLEKKSWVNHILVKRLLYNSIDNGKLPFGDLINFTLNEENNMENFEISILKIVHAVDLISMLYEVKWPMNMIFTKEIVAGFYEPLLKLMLKINIAFFSVTRLHFKDLQEIKLFTWRTRRLHLFRHWLILLLQKIQSYLSCAVDRCLNHESFEKSLKISTFTSLQQDYSNYLEKHKRDCLIKSEIKESIDRALHKVWLVCDDIRSLWSKAAKLQLTDKDVSQSVELYVQCGWYLTKTLQKFVKKDEQSPLQDLWSDLRHIVENHKQNIPEDLTFRYSDQVVV